MPRRLRTETAALVLLAAALRLPTLAVQSLWVDEAASARVLEAGSAEELLDRVADQESTPPLWYLLVWPWVRLAGDSELALRLPSALLGIALVPVVVALGTRLAGPRAGLLCGLLAATNPLLVWFSQEARAYALLVLLAAGAALAAVRALEGVGARGLFAAGAAGSAEEPGTADAAHRSTRALLAFGVLAGLALTTHFFALFVVAPLAAWVAWRLRDRPRLVLAGLAPIAACGLAVMPLALDQREADRAAFIRDEPLGQRVLAVPKQWLVGYDGPLEVVLAMMALTVAAAAVAALALRRHPVAPASAAAAATATASASSASGVRGVSLVLAASLAIPLGLALAGEDFLLSRNLLASLALALPLLAAGLTRLPLAAALALAAIGVVTCVGVSADRSLQRENWRDAVGALPDTPRLLVVVPGSGRLGAAHYLGRDLARGFTPVLAIDVLAMGRRVTGTRREVPRLPDVPPIAGFTRDRVVRGDGWAVVRFRSAPGEPVAVDASQVQSVFPDAAVLG